MVATQAERDYRVKVKADDAEMVERKVASGEYATANDVFNDGLQALRDREQSLDQWLQETVAPICGDIVAGRGTFMTPDEVYESIASELSAS